MIVEEVLIPVVRSADGAVAEAIFHLLRLPATSDDQRGVGVAQVVEAESERERVDQLITGRASSMKFEEWTP